MTPIEGLMVVTLIVAILSMTLSVIALWPKWKESLAMVRDGVLWIALIALVIGVATAALKRDRANQKAAIYKGASSNTNHESDREMHY